MKVSKIWLSGALALTCLACSPSDSPPSAPSQKARPKPAAGNSAQPSAPSTPTVQPAAAPSHSELVAKGRRAYLSNCTACHNIDPAKKGSLGPAVAGASEALIEARVVHGNYPPGYTPKADTKLMVALPYLKADVPALAAYLEK